MYHFQSKTGEQFGPLTLKQMKGLLADGTIGTDTLVWNGIGKEWTECHRFEELVPVVEEPDVITAVILSFFIWPVGLFMACKYLSMKRDMEALLIGLVTFGSMAVATITWLVWIRLV